MNPHYLFFSNKDSKFISEPSNNLFLKTIITNAVTDGEISITSVEIDGTHKELTSFSKLRIYAALEGNFFFNINDESRLSLYSGDFLILKSGVNYSFSGKGKYLVINVPAFKPEDDKYL